MSDSYREMSHVPATGNPTAGSSLTLDSRRREIRTAVIKRAKICFGPSLIDCVVLDVSPGGARIRMDVMIPLPATVILRFSGGSAFVARLQWARGTEVGFAFERSAPMEDGHASSVAASALKALPAGDLEVSMRLLRGARFFDDPALANAAQEAEAAYARFKVALRDRVVADE